ncbi:hypothetical protein SUGI_0849450 [Cryptomeria japonica]|uniref:uncharacterized protein LOC131060059 n=1 Tax=Cryptomeria japonica TaxID=3369 RepID=UPI0024147AD3|nr:uncharacterized protein LOC131060059 [Cryptomeria japonica]GLJ41030.1 hypothetical protein SUGI_0849450 [Cryptomeria japonica]
MASRLATAVATKWARRCRRYPVLTRRLYGSTTSSSADNTASDMIKYARQHSRSQNDTSYQEALRVLEQGLSIFQGADISTANAAGRLLLAMATLYTDRGDICGAIERLDEVSKMTLSSLEVRVAALEALIGLYLRMHQDVTASQFADKCLNLLEGAEAKIDEETLEALKMRTQCIKGLVELTRGHVHSAGSYFIGCQADIIRSNKNGLGAVALSYAEFVHVTGNFQLAKEFYELALEFSGTKDSHVPVAAAMVSEDVQLGAACGLGQLAIRTGNFDEAEQRLTQVLKKAEEYYGGHNHKVGIVLACIADMFGRKGRSEGANYFFIQEGLYRRALEMLKAPPLEQQVTATEIDLRDVVALVRGSYSQLLSQQRSRVGEAQKMREWADAVWSNNRISLEDVFGNTEASADEETRTSVILVTDMRLGRVL